VAGRPPRVSQIWSATDDVLADMRSIVWFLFDTARLSHVADAALTTASQSISIISQARLR
jgi:hypothetical protein